MKQFSLTGKCEPSHVLRDISAYANSEGPDQTAHMRSLIMAFPVRLVDA